MQKHKPTGLTSIAFSIGLLVGFGGILSNDAYAQATVAKRPSHQAGLLDSFLLQSGENKAFISQVFWTGSADTLGITYNGGMPTNVESGKVRLGTADFSTVLGTQIYPVNIGHGQQVDVPVNHMRILVHKHAGRWYAGPEKQHLRVFKWDYYGSKNFVLNRPLTEVTNTDAIRVLDQTKDIIGGHLALTEGNELYNLGMFSGTAAPFTSQPALLLSDVVAVRPNFHTGESFLIVQGSGRVYEWRHGEATPTWVASVPAGDAEAVKTTIFKASAWDSITSTTVNDLFYIKGGEPYNLRTGAKTRFFYTGGNEHKALYQIADFIGTGQNGQIVGNNLPVAAPADTVFLRNVSLTLLPPGAHSGTTAGFDFVANTSDSKLNIQITNQARGINFTRSLGNIPNFANYGKLLRLKVDWNATASSQARPYFDMQGYKYTSSLIKFEFENGELMLPLYHDATNSINIPSLNDSGPGYEVYWARLYQTPNPLASKSRRIGSFHDSGSKCAASVSSTIAPIKNMGSSNPNGASVSITYPSSFPNSTLNEMGQTCWVADGYPVGSPSDTKIYTAFDLLPSTSLGYEQGAAKPSRSVVLLDVQKHPSGTLNLGAAQPNEVETFPHRYIGMNPDGTLYSKGLQFVTASRSTSVSITPFATNSPLPMQYTKQPIGTPVATKGVFADKIRITWQSLAAEHEVIRNVCDRQGSNCVASAPILVAGNEFEDTVKKGLPANANGNYSEPSAKRIRYSVRASVQDPLYADDVVTTLPARRTTSDTMTTDWGYLATPPISTSATLTLDANGESNAFNINVVDVDDFADSYSYQVLTQGALGLASVGPDGKLHYVAGNQHGTDSFTYRVFDARGGYVDGTATVTVNCPAPELISVTPPSLKAWQDNVIAYQYRANACNGEALIFKFTAGAGSTAELEKYTRTHTVTAAAAATGGVVSFTNPDAGSYKLNFKLSSQKIPANKASQTLDANVTGMAGPTLTIAPTIPSEDDLVVASVSIPGDECKFHANESDARAFRECIVEWNHTLSDHEATVIDGKATLRGYGEVGGPQEIVARIMKADSQQELRLVDTKVGSIFVTPGTPITFNLPTFAKAQRQFFDLIDVALTQKTGQACTLTTSQAVATAEAQDGKKVCLIEFIDLPAGLSAAADGSPRLVGRLQDGANATVRFKASKFFLNKAPVTISHSEFTIPVTPSTINGTVTFDRAEYARALQVATVTAGIAGLPTCSLTNSLTEAKASYTKTTPLVCYGEWNNLPAWLTNKTGTSLVASGTVPEQPGNYPISYSLYMVDANDQKALMGTYTGTLKVIELPAIGMVVTPANVPMIAGTGEAVYPLDSTGVVGQFALQSTSLATVRATATMGTAVPMVITGIKHGESKELRIQAQNNPAWQVNDLSVRLEYEGIADKSRTRTEIIKVAQLPPKNMSALIQTPGQALVNTMPFTLRGKIGTPTTSATNLAYSSAAHGNWTAYIGAMEQPSIVQLTAKLPVAANGTVAFDGLRFQDVAGRDIVMVIEPNLPEGLVLNGQMRIVSPLAKLAFVSGAPILGTAIIDKTKGDAPHSVRLDVQVAQTDVQNLGTVLWEVSSNGGETWEGLDGVMGRAATYRFMMGGNYLVRAKLLNKNSGAEALTNIVAVDVRQLLRMQLDSPAMQLPGRPIELKLNVTATDGNEVPYHAEWAIQASNGSRMAYSNVDRVTINSDKVAAYDIVVRAKPEGMDANNPESWTTQTKTVRFAWPDPVRVSIGGAKRIETGNPLLLSGKVTASTGNGLPVVGIWELPEGASASEPLDSPSINVTFDPEVYSDGDAVDVIYRAWVDGAREKTETSLAHRIQLTKYEFANFVLTKKSETAVAPAYLRLQIEPANTAERRKIGSQKLTYAWAVPEAEGLVARASGNALTLTAQAPGQYPLTATVTDQRGNSQELSYVLSVAEPSGHVVSLGLREGLKFNRAPMTYSLRPNVTGGHPADKIAKFELFVNDESVQVSTGNRPPRSVVIPTPGEHKIKLAITTEMEKAAAGEEAVSVNPNKPPQCEELRVVWDRKGTAASIVSNCNDLDGRLKGFKWYLNDAVLEKRQGNRINLAPEQIGSTAEVRMEVIDDSNEVTTQTVTLTPPGAAAK